MKFYRSLYHFLYVFIFIIFPIFTSANEVTKTIKVLIKKPDDLESLYFNEKYQVIKQKYKELAQNDDLIKDTQLEFIHCPDEKSHETYFQSYYQHYFLKDQGYREFLNCVAYFIKKGECDLVILDDKLIFGDDAAIENYAINRLFGYNRVRSNFLKFNEIIDKKEYSFHNRTISEDGMLGKDDNKVYGLPFEIDFDVIYYFKDYEDKLSELKNSTAKYLDEWDQILDVTKFGKRSTHKDKNEHQSKNEKNEQNDKDQKEKDEIKTKVSVAHTYKGPISIALGDGDELLNIFIEYAGYQYSRKSVVDKRIEKLKLLESVEHFNDFKEFIKKATGTTDNEKELEVLLNVKPDKAYESFAVKREYPLYIGKASYFKYISSKNNNISVMLLPMGKTVITEKFVIANKNSNLNKKLLAKAALTLSSQRMQEYKIEQLGSIPTFSLAKENVNPNTYLNENPNINPNGNQSCPINQVICDSLEDVDFIRIKQYIFNEKSSSSIMEVRDIIPHALNEFLRGEKDTESIVKTFKNNVVLSSFSNDYMDIPFIILYGTEMVFVLLSIIVMIMVYQYRNHPYLKMISPRICILAVLGLVSTSVAIPFYGHFTSTEVTKITFIMGIIIRDLIFLPIFVIVYRIYYIYNNESKVNFGKKLNDRRLFSLIGIVMSINVIIGIVIVYTCEFYMLNVNCNQRHYFRMEFTGSKYYSYAYLLYYIIIVLSSLMMIYKTGKAKKKYDEIKIVYISIVLAIISTVMEWIYFFMPAKNFSLIFSIICFIYMSSCIFCIYLLVGSRLLYAIKHPVNPGNANEDNTYNDYFNVIDISDFVQTPQQSDKRRKTFSFSNNDNTAHNTNSVATSIVDNDSILNNPNNYFFNQSLEMLSKSENASSNNVLNNIKK